MVIYSKYKIVICSKYLNQHEMRLHKTFHMFDFIYYNNIIYHSPIMHLYYLYYPYYPYYH
jgi:hypothetical protein